MLTSKENSQILPALSLLFEIELPVCSPTVEETVEVGLLAASAIEVIDQVNPDLAEKIRNAKGKKLLKVFKVGNAVFVAIDGSLYLYCKFLAPSNE